MTDIILHRIDARLYEVETDRGLSATSRRIAANVLIGLKAELMVNTIDSTTCKSEGHIEADVRLTDTTTVKVF